MSQLLSVFGCKLAVLETYKLAASLAHTSCTCFRILCIPCCCICCCCRLLQVLDQDYDWVFGSDVTYTEEALLPLAKLLRQIVLTNEQCVVKLAHMHRSKDLDKAMRETFHGEAEAQLVSTHATVWVCRWQQQDGMV